MVTSLTGPVLAEYSDLYASVTTAGGPNGGLTLGAKAYTGDGREFRFCLAGASNLVQGKLQQAAAEVTAHENVAVQAAAASGATSVTVTLGAAAATANQYQNGWLMTSDGRQYSIASHPAANSAATLTLTLSDPLLAALTTSNTADLVANPYSNVVVSPTSLTAGVVGAAVFPITAAQYGWLQVAGPAVLLNAGGTTVGNMVVPSTTVAGAVKTAASTLPTIGYAMQTLTDTKYGPVYLTIG